MMQTDIIINRDCLSALRELPSDSVNCCVTSPPYFALRDYGMDGQIGRETTPQEYVDRLVEVFRELRRVLRPDGTFWLNISDTYCGTGSMGDHADSKNPKGCNGRNIAPHDKIPFCKAKDMIGIPWTLALALRNDGWYLRSDIIWEKRNTMPESVRDRPTKSYEHVFLLAKSPHYFYDAASIAEPVSADTPARMRRSYSLSGKYGIDIPGKKHQTINNYRPGGFDESKIPQFRNKRDVWHINTVPYKGAHFAAFPPKLAETCILAGCPVDGIIIDPFFGSGTTGAVAKQLGRHYIGIEINPEYCALAEQRIEAAYSKSNEAPNHHANQDGESRPANSRTLFQFREIEIPSQLTKALLCRAAEKGLSVEEFVERAIQKFMDRSDNSA